ncbi:MAG: radical SAM family heme chaperone HemW [Acidobacteriota bacterium]
MTDQPTLALYVHIPICAHKCYYCDFVSRPVESADRVQYLEALFSEIRLSPFRGSRARSLYLGGGTPSLLTGDEIAALVDLLEDTFQFEPEAEWTIEANPGTLSPACCDRLLELGFDRISIGVQSFQNRHLRRLGRLHTADQVFQSYQWFRQAGAENINLDLIFGIPDQELGEWHQDLETAVGLAPEHLSIYGLTIEPSTPFGYLREVGVLREPPEEVMADMYELTIDVLQAAGYEHYEISNFALPGYECQHNLTYWRNEPYLGFGISAASFVEGVRWTNTTDWETYLASARRGRVERATEERLPVPLALAEEVMLRIRTKEGVSPAELAGKYAVDFAALFAEIVEKLVETGLLERSDTGILRLTRRGKLLANEVCSEFLHAARELSEVE